MEQDIETKENQDILMKKRRTGVFNISHLSNQHGYTQEVKENSNEEIVDTENYRNLNTFIFILF